MSEQEIGRLIGCIIAHLRFQAAEKKKAFNEGDTLLSLCFKSDEELMKIAKLAGV